MSIAPWLVSPDRLAGPMVAVGLQALFLLIETAHERRRLRAAGRPAVPERIHPLRRTLFGLRRAGLVLAFVPLGQWGATLAPALTLGCAIFALGLAVRWLAIRTLGRWFRRTLEVDGDQPLVTTGVYRMLRHPCYAGEILVQTGIGITTGSVPAAVVLCGSTVALAVDRIRAEEQMLSGVFGARFDAYRRTSNRLLPWIY